MANCIYCGEFTSEGPSHRYESCGKAECDRWIRAEAEAERDEAHRRLDEDLGYY